MPTLSAMFRLMDGYSSQLNVLMNRMDEMTNRLNRASNAADDFNDDLDRTGSSSSSAASGIRSFISAAALMVATKKTMDMADSYTNIAARLAMVNDGTQTQAELQDKVFAAAERARGSYEDMASAVAKMNLLAGDSFNSNDEAIAFTELLQKSLKVSGAGTAEQQSAFLQLTQAMASGRLQGDEFRSIMENAPMVAQAIADYMGVTKGELKDLSSKGVITADIIKNAMFSAAEDINDKFDNMPMTFADVWNKIKNQGEKAFGGVFEKLNQALNSDEAQKAIGEFIELLYISGSVAEDVVGIFGSMFSFLAKGWGIIGPIVAAAVAGLIAYKIAQLASAVATTIANSAMLASPIFWIVAAIIIIIVVIYEAVKAFNDWAGTSYSATGIICGALATAGAFIANIFIGVYNALIGIVTELYNLFAGFANAIATMFNNPVSGIIMLFGSLLDFIIGFAQQAAKIIDSLFGTKIAESIEAFRNDVNSWIEEKVGDDKVTVMEKLDSSALEVNRISYKEAWDTGYGFGEGIDDKMSGVLSNIQNIGNDLGTDTNPAVFEGTGKDGSIDVNMADEDIQYLRDLAQREYVAKIANNTLAPNIRVEFSGPITETMSKEAIAGLVSQTLSDEISSTAEGVY